MLSPISCLHDKRSIFFCQDVVWFGVDSDTWVDAWLCCSSDQHVSTAPVLWCGAFVLTCRQLLLEVASVGLAAVVPVPKPAVPASALLICVTDSARRSLVPGLLQPHDLLR